MSDKHAIEEQIKAFPALPRMCGYIMSHWDDPDVDMAKLAADIRYDPGLTANVLKLANSAFYGLPRRVDSLQAAITMLGLKKLGGLIVLSSASDVLEKGLDGYRLGKEELLSHSIWVAVASEELCHVLGMRPQEMLFTCGLLHDIGKLILDQHIADSGPGIAGLVDSQGYSFDQAEQTVIGMSHAEVGAMLLDSWNFPEELVETVRWHHDPTGAGEQRELADVIHVADMLAYSEGIGAGVDGFRYRLCQESAAKLGVKPKHIENAAARAFDKINELSGLIEGKA